MIQNNLFTSDVIADPYAYYGGGYGRRPNFQLERGPMNCGLNPGMTNLNRLFAPASRTVSPPLRRIQERPRPGFTRPSRGRTPPGLVVRFTCGTIIADQFITRTAPSIWRCAKIRPHLTSQTQGVETWRPFVAADALKELLDGCPETEGFPWNVMWRENLADGPAFPRSW